jgi:hypothetical protein
MPGCGNEVLWRPSTDEIAHSLRPTGADEIPALTGAILALVLDVLAPR